MKTARTAQLPGCYTQPIGSLPRPQAVRDLLAARNDMLPERYRQRLAGLGLGMGVVDVRGERLQSVEQIENLAAAGAKIVGVERIALNPDCGFAPDAGEPPTIDEAYEKLRRMVEAAERLRRSLSLPS